MYSWTGINNVDFSVAGRPFGVAKDCTKNQDGTPNKDGTPVNKITSTEDIYNAMLNALKLVDQVPNENPENAIESQFIDALFLLFGGVGEIIKIIGTPAPNSRLLRLDGSLIDLTQAKFKYLRKWIEENKKSNPDIFVEKDTADPSFDRFKFKFIAGEKNKIWLPSPKQGDILKQFDILDSTTLSTADDGEGGGVGEHQHEVEPFGATIPAHTHAMPPPPELMVLYRVTEGVPDMRGVALIGWQIDGVIADAPQFQAELLRGVRTIKMIPKTKRVANIKPNIINGTNACFYIKY